MGVFRKNATLVGNIPTELSNLIGYFLKDVEEKFASTAAVVSQKTAFVVPDKFTAVTKKLRVATFLPKEALKQKF